MKYDIISTRIRKTVSIKKPDDIYVELKRYAKSRQEQFFTITLDGSHDVIGIHLTTIGLVNKTVIHPREILIHLIKDNACSFIIAHNHTSNSIIPSDEDILGTKQIKRASDILEFHLLDHLIFNKYGFYSFRQNGLIE
jgi:DNA repair protein RadC